MSCPSPLRQLALQFAPALIRSSVGLAIYASAARSYRGRETCLATGGTALLLCQHPVTPTGWWRVIHAGFAMPLGMGRSPSHWRSIPGWFLLAAILLLLFYRGAVSGRYPLSVQPADGQALGELLVEQAAK